MLIVGKAELNPGPQTKEKFMVEQGEEMKGMREWLEKIHPIWI
jgi:hypothetical protein